jgi:hypothetical protein
MKTNILKALSDFANQKPRLEFGNYGDAATYRAEMRAITKDLHHVRHLLRAVELRESITAQSLVTAADNAFSGRLTIYGDYENGGVRIDYCTGQYFPTEYRKAVAAVLSRALWNYWASDATDAQRIRNTARANLPRAIATAYFN